MNFSYVLLPKPDNNDNNDNNIIYIIYILNFLFPGLK